MEAERYRDSKETGKTRKVSSHKNTESMFSKRRTQQEQPRPSGDVRRGGNDPLKLNPSRLLSTPESTVLVGGRKQETNFVLINSGSK